jgi:hypothetical protein
MAEIAARLSSSGFFKNPARPALEYFPKNKNFIFLSLFSLKIMPQNKASAKPGRVWEERVRFSLAVGKAIQET